MASDAYGAAAKSATSAVRTIDAQVSRNPYKTLLVALGIGLAIGFMGRK
jgi:ElaB/YqjD/DUF883 family membrane-anchored ribosome-binding protein